MVALQGERGCNMIQQRKVNKIILTFISLKIMFWVFFCFLPNFQYRTLKKTSVVASQVKPESISGCVSGLVKQPCTFWVYTLWWSWTRHSVWYICAIFSLGHKLLFKTSVKFRHSTPLTSVHFCSFPTGMMKLIKTKGKTFFHSRYWKLWEVCLLEH